MVVKILNITKPLPNCLHFKNNPASQAAHRPLSTLTLGVLYCFDLGEAEEPKVEVEGGGVGEQGGAGQVR